MSPTQAWIFQQGKSRQSSLLTWLSWLFFTQDVTGSSAFFFFFSYFFLFCLCFKDSLWQSLACLISWRFFYTSYIPLLSHQEEFVSLGNRNGWGLMDLFFHLPASFSREAAAWLQSLYLQQGCRLHCNFPILPLGQRLWVMVTGFHSALMELKTLTENQAHKSLQRLLKRLNVHGKSFHYTHVTEAAVPPKQWILGCMLT